MKVNIATYLNNFSLGSVPKSNSTLFIKYRIGGGKETNLGVNVITNVDDVEFNVNGPNSSINTQVVNSLTVTNITPAVGGSDQPTIEEIRNMVAYNFAAQNRAVTLNDYKSLIETMPATFGAPAKVNVMEENNKIKVNLLSYDDKGNLTNVVSNTLKSNITNYLSEYKMINDFVEIISGQVIDLSLSIDINIDRNFNQTEIMRSTIETVIDYFSIDKRKMGDPLFVGKLMRDIGNVPGVENVIEIKVFNKIGGQYSTAQVIQPYIDTATKEIRQTDMTIRMASNQIFQIRFPEKDIQVRVRSVENNTF
jgi:hypothetical protein